MKPVTLIPRWVAALAVSLAACHAPTAPSPITIVNPSADDILAHRALWAAHAPPLYSYVVTTSGGFGASFNDRPLQVVVRNDTVEMATFFDTQQPFSKPYTFWPPTIDGLFDLAAYRVGEGELSAISFDSVLSYPARMAFTNPDLPSIEAADLSSATPR
ncbi:MAG TPA: DUF6174 domain-containing protein [Gemmatimonadales bacterium]|jgi:hypothetical protein